MPTETPWRRVLFAADCDEDSNCPVCGIDYGECDGPGPTMDEMEYREIDGVLWARSRPPTRTPRRASTMPTPLSLTDQEMAAVPDAAAPIDLRAAALSWKISPANWRSVPRGFGLGSIHRIAREIQHRYIDVVGRHARGRL